MIDQNRMTGELLDAQVLSIPNGQQYGKPGWVPCDHVLCCDYERVTRWFDGRTWTETWKTDKD